LGEGHPQFARQAFGFLIRLFRVVRGEANLGTVHAACAKLKRREEAVEIVDGAAADERKSAAKRFVGPGEGIDERWRNEHRAGSGREVEERPVDIEKERG